MFKQVALATGIKVSIPALNCRIHKAKQAKTLTVTAWGAGTPNRDFPYGEDVHETYVCQMTLSSYQETDRNAVKRVELHGQHRVRYLHA